MENKAIIIRPITVKDATAYRHFLQKVQQETNFVPIAESATTMSAQWCRLMIASSLATTTDQFWIAVNQQQIIGALRISSATEPGLTHIGELSIAILKAFWSQKIGSTLMQQSITAVINQRQPRRLELTVQARNRRAIQLYQKFGFKKEGVLKAGYHDPDVGFITVNQMARLINMTTK